MESGVFDGCKMRFAGDEVLYLEVYCLFDFIPGASLVTGYSEQQHGIWYYPKEFPKLTTKVLSFSYDADYVIKIKFTDSTGATCEKIFSYDLAEYDNVGGWNYRVMLKSIRQNNKTGKNIITVILKQGKRPALFLPA